MDSGLRYPHFLVAAGFSLFFLLHGINEQFGLIRLSVTAELAVYYLVVSLLVAWLSALTVNTSSKATVLTFILLCIFFFFGAAKDALQHIGYKIFIPLVAVVVLVVYTVIRKTRSNLRRASTFTQYLVLIFLVVEVGTLVYNFATHKEKQRDLGDIDHALIKNVIVPAEARKPVIVWIVMDEYSGASGLKKGWNYSNPFDSILRERNFFVADSAISPYNYTHYSLVSTLDMTYLSTLKDSAVIGFRDIVRGNISLQSTNAVELLKQNGYNIINQTIYNVDGYPSQAREYFVDADRKLIDNQTMPGRIRQDLGWQFSTMMMSSEGGYEAAKSKALAAEAKYRQDLLSQGLEAASQAARSEQPAMLMFHYMFTHEPFLYNADGSLDLSVGFGMYPNKYIPSIEYANHAMTGFIDSLLQVLKGREAVIVIQGDHGYKFEEADSLYKQEGCSILYAVYCSDLQYPGWSSSFNSVNGFRVLFNKYFLTSFPILENRSYDLLYR